MFKDRISDADAVVLTFSAFLNPLCTMLTAFDGMPKGASSQEEVIEMVDRAYSFGFKLYMDNETMARHTGILGYLDDECSFTLDFGDNGKGFNRVVGSLDRSKYKVSGPFILRMDIDSDSDKQTVKDILCEWCHFQTGIYNIWLNNCRHFCQDCMEIAERYRSLDRKGKTAADNLLSRLQAEDRCMLPLLAAPFSGLLSLSRTVSNSSN